MKDQSDAETLHFGGSMGNVPWVHLWNFPKWPSKKNALVWSRQFHNVLRVCLQCSEGAVWAWGCWDTVNINLSGGEWWYRSIFMQCHLHDPLFPWIAAVTFFLRCLFYIFHQPMLVSLLRWKILWHAFTFLQQGSFVCLCLPLLKILKDVISPAVKQQPVPQIPHNKTLPWSSVLTRLLQCDQWSNKQIHATCFTGSRAFAAHWNWSSQAPTSIQYPSPASRCWAHFGSAAPRCTRNLVVWPGNVRPSWTVFPCLSPGQWYKSTNAIPWFYKS